MTTISDATNRVTRHRVVPSFVRAIGWLCDNDDTEWALFDKESSMGSVSVTGALVADMFGKTDEDVRLAVRKGLRVRGRPSTTTEEKS